MLSADGTEYQMVSSFSSAKRTASAGKTVALVGTSTTGAPAMAAAKRSKTERSKWNGAWLERRSAAVTPIVRTAQSTNDQPLRWLNITPLGRPVEPDV